MQKVKDLVVSTGTYTDNQGQTKHRYKNVGSVMQNENGQFLIMDRTFNPAGVPNPENKEGVFISMFDVKERSKQPQYQPYSNEKQPATKPVNQQTTTQAQDVSNFDEISDSIPF